MGENIFFKKKSPRWCTYRRAICSCPPVIRIWADRRLVRSPQEENGRAGRIWLVKFSSGGAPMVRIPKFYSADRKYLTFLGKFASVGKICLFCKKNGCTGKFWKFRPVRWCAAGRRFTEYHYRKPIKKNGFEPIFIHSQGRNSWWFRPNRLPHCMRCCRQMV